MKKVIKKLFIALIISLIISGATPETTFNPVLNVEAHSGRTDSRGGHHDYKNKSGLGSYHYHHGYPAHLHRNGVCPYSGSSDNIKTTTQNTTSNVAKSNTALQTKYKAYTDDYNNKLKTGYFQQDINAVVLSFISNSENSVYLYSLLTTEETADLLTTNNNSVQNDILSKIIYTRVYEVVLQQSIQQQMTSSQEDLETVQSTAINEEAQKVESQDDFLFNLVSQVQIQLQALGFYLGEIDGIFDIETQQSLINFQNTYGLIPDGTINEQVIIALSINI